MERNRRTLPQLERDLDVLDLYLEDGRSVEDIALEFSMHKSSVYRLISEFKDKNAIRSTVDALALIEVTRNLALEKQFTDEFPLDRATIISVPDALSPRDNFHYRIDSILHSALGRAAYDAYRPVLVDGLPVGVGGGRALAEFAECAIKDTSLRYADNVFVTSLAGGLLGANTATFSPSLCADIIATRIASKVIRPTKLSPETLRLTSSPPYTTSRVGISDIGTRSCRDVQYALFGIGSVHRQSKHFLFQSATVLDDEELAYDAGISELYEEIDAIEASLLPGSTNRGYHPLVERLNHLDVVAPLGADRLRLATDLDGLRAAAARLNRFAAGPAIENLTAIPHRVGIGGGIHKAFALLEQMQEGVITEIVTDQVAAMRVLSLKRSPRHRAFVTVPDR